MGVGGQRFEECDQFDTGEGSSENVERTEEIGGLLQTGGHELGVDGPGAIGGDAAGEGGGDGGELLLDHAEHRDEGRMRTMSWGRSEEQKIRGIEWAAEEATSPAIEVREVMGMEPGEGGGFVDLHGF